MVLPPSKRQELAASAGTTVAYLSKLVRGHGAPSIELADKIVKAWNRRRIKPVIAVEDFLRAREARAKGKV